MKNWVWIIVGVIAIGAILDQCSCSHDQNSPKNYINAVNDNDFDKAHEILDNLYATYLQYPDGETSAQRYWTAAEYIYKAEMQWLLPQHDIEADRRLIYTLDAFNPVGLEPVGNYAYGLSEHNSKYQQFSGYCRFAEEYNKLCIELIKISLRNENLPLAELTLSTMKNCYIKENKDNTYTYVPNDSDKERAKELIENYKKENI